MQCSTVQGEVMCATLCYANKVAQPLLPSYFIGLSVYTSYSTVKYGGNWSDSGSGLESGTHMRNSYDGLPTVMAF